MTALEKSGIILPRRNPLRVLLINYEFPPIGAGAGNAMANIARCLAHEDTEVRVLTARWRNLARVEQRDGYTIYRVPSIRRRADRCTPFEMLTFVLGGVGSALATARSWQPDVTCAFFGVPSGPLALLLRRRYGIPYVVSLRGGDVPGFLGSETARLHRLTWPLTSAVWRNSAGLVANSVGLKQLALQSWPAAPIEVIPNGVDVDTFQPVERDRTAAPFRLLFVGRLVAQKCLPVLIESLARLQTPTVLRIVGDGPERGAIELLARQSGVRDQCEFIGWSTRDGLPLHYAWADAFVLPSIEEGMANVVLEAMSAGLAVVTTDIYGNRNLIDNGVTGLLVPTGSSAALAAAITSIANDLDLRCRLGAAAREAALTRGWDSVARRYREILARAAGSRQVLRTTSQAGGR